MKKLLFILALCACSQVFAQSNSDYIITLESDTIYGEILSEDWAKLAKNITFIDEDDNELKYSANELKGFNIQGYVFEAMDVNGFNPLFLMTTTKRRFLLKVVDGKNKLYAHFWMLTYQNPEDGLTVLENESAYEDIKYYALFESGYKMELWVEEDPDDIRQIIFPEIPLTASSLTLENNELIKTFEAYNNGEIEPENFSGISNSTDLVDIYIFRNRGYSDDSDDMLTKDIKLKIGNLKLPELQADEYFHITFPDIWNYVISVKGKRLNEYVEVYSSKKHPVLIELSSYDKDYNNPVFTILSPEEAKEQYLADLKEVKITASSEQKY